MKQLLSLTFLLALSVAIFGQNLDFSLQYYPEITQEMIEEQKIKSIEIEHYDTTIQSHPLIKNDYHFNESGQMIRSEFYGGETYTDAKYALNKKGRIKGIEFTIYGKTEQRMCTYGKRKRSLMIEKKLLNPSKEVGYFNKKRKLYRVKSYAFDEERAIYDDDPTETVILSYNKKGRLIERSLEGSGGEWGYSERVVYEYIEGELTKQEIYINDELQQTFLLSYDESGRVKEKVQIKSKKEGNERVTYRYVFW